MERKELIETATALKLDFKKNMKTDALKALVISHIDKVNGMFNSAPEEWEVEKVYCGKSPLDNKEIWK